MRNFFNSNGSIEIRSNDDGTHTLTGRGITFNVQSNELRTQNGKKFIESVPDTAEIRMTDDCKVTVDHKNDAFHLIGRRGVNADFERRSDGIYYSVVLPDTSIANDVRALASQGLATGCSFEFRCIQDATEERSDGMLVRELRSIEVTAINPLVTVNPAYNESTVEARSVDEYYEKKETVNTFTNNEGESYTVTEERESKRKITYEYEHKETRGMNLTELKDARASLIEKQTEIRSLANKEERSLTENEISAISTLQAEARGIESVIQIETEAERANGAVETEKRSVEVKEPAFVLKNENQMVEFRALSIDGATGSTLTDANIAHADVAALQGALNPASAFEQLGCTVHSPISNNLRIPIANKLDALPTFKGETGAADAQTVTFRDIALTPKRLPVEVILSSRYVAQDAVGATNYAISEATRSLKEAMQKQMLSDAVGSATAPEGLFNAATDADFDATAGGKNWGYTDALAARGTLAASNVNVGKVKAITSYGVDSMLRGESIVGTEARFVLEGNTLTNIGMTVNANNMINHSVDGQDVMLMGDFSHVHVAFFRNVEVIYDPYTYASNAQVRYVFNFEVDWKLAHEEALLAITDLAV